MGVDCGKFVSNRCGLLVAFACLCKYLVSVWLEKQQLTELRNEPFAKRYLSAFPPRILEAAESRGRQRWKFLREVLGLLWEKESPTLCDLEIEGFINAAESQEAAERRLGEICYGFGTIRSSPWERLEKANERGDEPGSWRLQKNIVHAYLQSGTILALLNPASPPEVAEVERARAEIQDDMRKRYGKGGENKATTDLTDSPLSDMRAHAVVLGWLRLVPGIPGFAFMSTESAVNLLQFAGEPTMNSDYFNKLRSRLKLRPAMRRNPFVRAIERSGSGYIFKLRETKLKVSELHATELKNAPGETRKGAWEMSANRLVRKSGPD